MMLTLAVHHMIVSCFLLPSAVCDFFTTGVNLIKDIAGLVANPIGFFFKKVWYEGCAAQSGSAPCPGGVQGFLSGALSNSLTGPYKNAFMAVRPAAIILAGIAAGMRIVRGLYDDRIDGIHLITDTLLRFGIVFLVLGPPIAGVGSFAWTVLGFLTGHALPYLDQQLSHTLGSQSVWGCGVAACFSITAWLKTFAVLVVASLFGFDPAGWLVAICLFVILLMMVYIAGLLLLRMVMLTFACCIAPLGIALAAYDTRNKFFTWWFEMLVAALMIPFVATVGLTITIGVAAQFSPAAKTGMATSVLDVVKVTVVFMCGSWMTGKMIHQLTWRHFSHGGVTGAITAASTTAMALPMIANDVRALGSAMGFRFKPGGMWNSLADGKTNQFGIKDPYGGGGAAAAAADSAAPSGASGGLADSLSSNSQTLIQGSGGARAFNAFASQAFGRMGGPGASISQHMNILPGNLQAGLAESMVPAFLGGNVDAAAQSASVYAPQAQGFIDSWTQAQQTQSHQAAAAASAQQAAAAAASASAAAGQAAAAGAGPTTYI